MFVEVVTKTTYENLQQYDQFLNESLLDELDMLQIAKEVWDIQTLLAPDFVLLNQFFFSFCFSDARIFATRVGLQFSSYGNGHLLFYDLSACTTKCV